MRMSVFFTPLGEVASATHSPWTDPSQLFTGGGGGGGLTRRSLPSSPMVMTTTFTLFTFTQVPTSW